MAMLKGGAVLTACLALANARRGAIIGPVCCKELLCCKELSLLPCAAAAAPSASGVSRSSSRVHLRHLPAQPPPRSGLNRAR